MSETTRRGIDPHPGYFYLGLAVVCLAVGLYLFAGGAFDAAGTIFMVAVGSALLSLSYEPRMREAGLVKVLRYGGMGVTLLAAVLELVRMR